MKVHERVAGRFVRAVLDRFTWSDLKDFMSRTAIRRARSLPPDEGLRFLLGLEAALYSTVGELSVAYGGGVHTKHRHTRYHDFFVSRVRADDRVLDLGCGIGAVAYDLAERTGARVVAVDHNAQTIAQARHAFPHPRVEYRLGNVLQDPIDEVFDVVILSNVLEHLPDRPAFLLGLVDAVRPSRVLIRVPLFERDWRVPLKKELGVEWRLDLSHETEHTLESFAQEMREAGLLVSHQEVRWGEIWAEAVPRAQSRDILRCEEAVPE